MGIAIDIYFLYQLENDKHLLLKVGRPGFSNANQNEENWADEISDNKKNILLQKYLNKHELNQAKFIGEFQGLPEGDILYDEKGQSNLTDLWFTQTTYGHPWIFLSLAQSEEEFWAICEEENFADNGMKKENLLTPAFHLACTDFITENDFDHTT